MQTKLHFIPLILALGALVLTTSGCATISSRIARERAHFDALPREDQAMIRSGKIAVGFDETSVWMASKTKTTMMSVSVIGRDSASLEPSLRGGQRC